MLLNLVSESIPSVPKSSVVITELDPSDSECLSDIDSTDLDESLALLTNTFRRFARKSNFQKPKPLSFTNKPKSTRVDKATSICYNCQGKGHFASECRSRKDKFAPSSSSSIDAKYLQLKEKYRKIKTQRKSRGLVVEDHDWADSSDESSDEEDNTESPCLMALNDETEISLMAKLEEVPEDVHEASTSSVSTSASQVSTTPTPSDSLSALDSLTVDLYNALNGKSSAEKLNVDLRDQLKVCHDKIRELTVFEKKS